MAASELNPIGDRGHPVLESAQVNLGTVGTGRPGGGLLWAGRTGRVETVMGTGGIAGGHREGGDTQ